MIHREFKFDLSEVKDDGHFSGVSAVYGNVDLGDDIIERGALTKTISDNQGRFPLLADHRIPIGIAYVEDSADGLKTNGVLNLEKQSAKDTHSDLRFYHAHGRPYGMSIGYDPIKKKREGDFRVLKEIRLVEVSTTLFPMNPQARVSAVKSAAAAALIDKYGSELKQMMQFDEVLDAAQSWSMRHQMLYALGDVLDSVLYDGSASREEKINAAEVSLQQFSSRFMELVPHLLDIMDGRSKSADAATSTKSLVALLKSRFPELFEAAAPLIPAEPGIDLHSVALDRLNSFRLF